MSPLVFIFLGWGLLALVWQVAYLLGFNGEWALQWMGIGLGALWVVWAVLVFGRFRSHWADHDRFRMIINWLWPGAMGLGLLVVYLFFDRAHLDDGLFLPRALDLLSEPGSSVRELGKDSVPGTYREDRLLSLYWLVPAVLHSWTGIPFLSLYYGVVPGLLILLTPYAWDFCLRAWFGITEWRKRIWIILIASILLLVWGKNSFWVWIPNNFSPLDDGVLRFQQGDAVLATMVVPVWLGLLARFRANPKVGHAFGLVIAAAAGVGFSPIGLFLGLVILGMMGISEVVISGSRGGRFILWSIPVILYVASLAFVSVFCFDSGAGIIEYGGLFRVDDGLIRRWSNGEALRATWGVAAPGMIAIGAVLFLAVMATPVYTRVYAAVILILLLIPGTSILMGELGYSVFGWRWLWSLPIFLVVGYAIVELIGRLWLSSRWLALLLIVALSYLYGLDGRMVLNAESGENDPRIRWAPIKVDSEEILRNDFTAERQGPWILYRGGRF